MSQTSRAQVRIGFIGLGVMGYHMAGHLARAGYPVTVYNRTTAKAQRWVKEFGGAIATTPAQAARHADLVCSCVGNDDDLRAVALGPHGVLAGMKTGSVWVDHTTTSADVAQQLAALAVEQSKYFIDAPVSGGESGAQKGTLAIMCGGVAEALTKIEPILKNYAKTVTLMGPSGTGQLTKMVNQICIAGILQGLAEAIDFGQQVGLNMPKVLEVIGGGAAASWQLQQRGPTMCAGKFDFGFAVDWMRKDLGLCLAEARRHHAALPLTALVDQFYAEVQALGGARWDTSSLIKRLGEKKIP